MNGRPVVAIIGASNNRKKFGNKAVRAYLAQGFEVYPVNLHEKRIEGRTVYRSVRDIPIAIDRVSVYLPPPQTLTILDDVAAKGTGELYLNPGSESEQVLARARELGLAPILACSVIAIDDSPDNYP